MKYIYITVLFGLMFGTSNAQSLERQVISSYGSLSTTSAATVGEAVTRTGISGTYTLNQGFQQAPKNEGVAIKDLDLKIAYQVYPNPVRDLLNIELSTTGDVNFELSVLNALGQKQSDLISASVQNNWNGSLKVGHLAPGIYFLELVEIKSKHIQSIKFIKQ